MRRPVVSQPASHRRGHYPRHSHVWTPRHLGEDALHFGTWFAKNKFALMEGFLGELRDSPAERDPSEIEDRFLRATRHAQRVLVARGVVTFFLALGLVATASATIAGRVWIPTRLAGDVTAWLAVLDGAAAIAASVTLVLLAARLAFDRYLELVETTATFLAIELATCSRPTLRRGTT